MVRATRRLVCLHGVGGDPADFTSWRNAFPGWQVVVPDLQRAVPDLARASMEDYAAEASACLGDAPGSVLCGWSMGGLVALMVAACHPVGGLVLIEASLPGDVTGFDDAVPLEEGTFHPDDVYGPRRDGLAARPDSLWAKSERRRGVSIGRVDCPVLVIGGIDFTESRARPLAAHYGADLACFPDLDHVGLLYSPEVLDRVARWLAALSPGPGRRADLTVPRGMARPIRSFTWRWVLGSIAPVQLPW